MPMTTLTDCDCSRGAPLGRQESGPIAEQIDRVRSDLRITEGALKSFAEGFEPGWYERNAAGELIFTPNFPTPESRADWVAGLEAKAAGMRAELARLERSPGEGQRFRLARVRIDSGGYDSGGAYWGLGAPLFRFESEDGQLSGFLRARDREAAKSGVREDYPSARFFR